MSTSSSLLTRVFPVRKEHIYDGVLTTFAAAGSQYALYPRSPGS